MKAHTRSMTIPVCRASGARTPTLVMANAHPRVVYCLACAPRTLKENRPPVPTLPEITNREIVASSKLFAVEEMDLLFANGERRTYERLPTRGAEAVIVAAIDDDNLVLIREYMAGFHRYELSLPKGRVDAGESLEAAANRELKEEAGFGARDVRHLRRISLAPAHMGFTIHVMLARGLYPERLPGDEPEPFEVVTWPMGDLDRLVTSEEFSESRAIAALKLVEIFLAEEARRGD